MAAIRIPKDQENICPDHRQGKPTMAAQPKRPALGVLNDNKPRKNNVLAPKAKPLGVSNACNQNVADLKAYYKDFNRENSKAAADKENSNPVVPVAEFEAFKVYEDTTTYEEKLIRIDEKLKAKSTSYVYKGTIEDRFYTKTEVADLERKGIIPAKKEIEETPEPILMSVEKCEDISIGSLLESGRQKDLFFEMEEYRCDIYRYLREHEMRNRPKPGYMKKQPDVTSSMRTILVDWLVEVGQEYKLHNETLYLSVNYIDRFLSYMSVVRGKLQLVGTAAMFLASKYEEIYPPNISEFVYITDDTYTTRQVVRMEQLILKVLGFDLSVPTPLTFITAICVANRLNKETMYLAMYLCELSLLNGEMHLEFLPSTLAAAAIAIARHTLGQPAWPAGHAATTGYDLSALLTCIDFLNVMFRTAPTMAQHAIQDKYKDQKYLHVSDYKPKDSPILSN